MDSDIPPTRTTVPTEPAPPTPESAEDRHMREFNQSLGTLEDTVEHWLVRVLKIAIPLLVGVAAAAVGMYALGQFLRDRAEQKRVARAIRRARSPRGRRARAELIAS
jgi:hypothetical protein